MSDSADKGNIAGYMAACAREISAAGGKECSVGTTSIASSTSLALIFDCGLVVLSLGVCLSLSLWDDIKLSLESLHLCLECPMFMPGFGARGVPDGSYRDLHVKSSSFVAFGVCVPGRRHLWTLISLLIWTWYPLL